MKSLAADSFASMEPALAALKLLDAQGSAMAHTVTLESIGTQISGRLTGVRSDALGQPYFLKFTGPTQIHATTAS